jgi:hypothetical protein
VFAVPPLAAWPPWRRQRSGLLAAPRWRCLPSPRSPTGAGALRLLAAPRAREEPPCHPGPSGRRLPCGREARPTTTPLAHVTARSKLPTPAASPRRTGRWANHYVEGLARLLQPPLSLDGIYYDGIGFGVHTMRRVHRVMAAEARRRDDGRPLTIDLHSGNNLLGDRYGRVSPALQVATYHPCACACTSAYGY